MWLYFSFRMFKFVGTGTAQHISIAKLLVSSKCLKKCMVIKGLKLILSQNIKQFTNLRHFQKSIYECSKLSFGGVLKKRCNLSQNMQILFEVLALHNNQNETRFLSLWMVCSSSRKKEVKLSKLRQKVVRNHL